MVLRSAKPASSTKKRVRRTPEEARTALLDAADRVFAARLPDAVGLKEIAHEAGVSHALVTHYFRTYDGVLEAALERRIRALREVIFTRLGDAGAVSRPGELLGILFRALEDPIHLKLVKWLVASGRSTSARAFALQDHGLQLVAHQVAEAIAPRPTKETINTIELALLTAVSAAYGYATTKYALAGALGRVANNELDAGVQRTLAAMLQVYLRETLKSVISPGSLGS